MNKSIEQLHAELVQPTTGLAHMPGDGRPSSDPAELQDICNVGLNPVTTHERHLYRDEFTWAGGQDELEFERYVVGKRRIEYFTRQLEASRGILGGSNE